MLLEAKFNTRMRTRFERNGQTTFIQASGRRARKDFKVSLEAISLTLYSIILALDRKSPHNWLDDKFWLKKTYMEWRAPLLVNSNWWLAFCDDDIHPTTPTPASEHTDWQLKRAAWLLHRTLEFKDKVDAYVLPSF